MGTEDQTFIVCLTNFESKEKMLLGQHLLLLEKDRFLAIPESIRGLFTDGAYITRGFEQNLLIMSDTVFRERYERLMGLNIADPLTRLLLRLILGNASKLYLSKSGQVLLPQDLMVFASLEKEVVLVGQGDYLEVWAPMHWQKQTTILLDAEANAKRFAHLDIALN
jgi:MraZ protein